MGSDRERGWRWVGCRSEESWSVSTWKRGNFHPCPNSSEGIGGRKQRKGGKSLQRSRYWTGCASGRAGSSWRGTLSFQGGDATCQQHQPLQRHPTMLDSHSSEASRSHQAWIGFRSSPAGAPRKGSLSAGMMTGGGEQRGCTRDTAEMAIGHLLCQWEPWVLKMQLSTYQRKRTQRKHGL